MDYTGEPINSMYVASTHIAFIPRCLKPSQILIINDVALSLVEISFKFPIGSLALYDIEVTFISFN